MYDTLQLASVSNTIKKHKVYIVSDYLKPMYDTLQLASVSLEVNVLRDVNVK